MEQSNMLRYNDMNLFSQSVFQKDLIHTQPNIVSMEHVISYLSILHEHVSTWPTPTLWLLRTQFVIHLTPDNIYPSDL